jgi:hypothetical protein
LRRAACTALVLSLLLAGCGRATEDAGTSLPTDDGPGLSIAVSTPAGARDTPMARVRGVVEFDTERGCVLLSQQAAIWPEGTRLVADPLGLRLADGRLVEPGDRVTAPGGNVPASRESLAGLATGDVAHLLECSGGDEVVLLGPTEDVELDP